MTFSVYNTTTHQLVVQITDDHLDYLAPGFVEPLKKISTTACFMMYVPGECQKVFGNLEEISKDHPLYPKALKMYFEAQMLTHPEAYTITPPSNQRTISPDRYA